MLLSVIVPVYNEERSVGDLLKRVQRVPVPKEIVVVDDGSTDRTPELVRSILGIRVITHPHNCGKGVAIRSGLAHAQGDVVLIQDADLEYEPEDYPRLLEPFLNDDRVAAVFGSRFKGKGEFLFRSRLANIFLTFFTNTLFGGKITDMETCYKVVRRSLFAELKLSARRFDVEPEITAKLLRCRRRIVEVPISYHGRREGKKIGWKDGISACWTLLKWYVS